MTESLSTGLKLLAGGAVFAGFFVLNLGLGNAPVSAGLQPADRRKNPFGFWFVETFLGAIALMAFLAGVLVISGVSPP